MNLFGRRVCWSDEEKITAENVVKEVRKAFLETHSANKTEIEYLYKYYKGEQPILSKVKEIRPEINYKIPENRANEIVSFKVGFLVGKPIQYIAAVSDEKLGKAISALNDLMRAEGKATKDRELVEWQMICGTGYRLTLPEKNARGRIPFHMYTLNPGSTFVIYANDYTRRPLAGVTYKTSLNRKDNTFTVYTEENIFTIRNTKLVSVEENPLGMIPIVEYPVNNARLGCFEIVLPILDAISELDSNRLDAVAQFVESLLVFYNCDFEEGTTANTIRESGMILLKSFGDSKADMKEISSSLNQTDNETLKTSFLQAVHEIVGMPTQNNGSGNESSNNGAVVLKTGWQGAETRAEEFEAMFLEPERRTLELVSFIMEKLGYESFAPEDVDIKFSRRAYEDIMSKSQTLVTLLNSNYVHPRDAYEASGLFVDSEGAFQNGVAWAEEHKQEQKQEVTDEEPVAGTV